MSYIFHPNIIPGAMHLVWYRGNVNLTKGADADQQYKCTIINKFTPRLRKIKSLVNIQAVDDHKVG
jgi:hypothetical protein